MKSSILQLQDLRFIRARVDINPEFKGDADEFDFEGSAFRWDVRFGNRDDKPLQFWLGLEYALQGDSERASPYALDMKAVGFFDVDESVPKEKQASLVYENGAALVYGAIREMIANITSRSLFGTLMLPTASFIGTYAEHVLQETEKAKAVNPIP